MQRYVWLLPVKQFVLRCGVVSLVAPKNMEGIGRLRDKVQLSDVLGGLRSWGRLVVCAAASWCEGGRGG